MDRPEWMAAALAERLQAALAAVQRGVGEKLQSVSLVGTAVAPARHAAPHRVQLLVVVDDLPVATLSNLANQARGLRADGIGLRLLTTRELLRSADVFTLELADYRARHWVLHGREPFTDLHFTAAELRSAIERNLRLAAQHVRQQILGDLMDTTHADEVRAALGGIIDDVVVIADHLLQMLGAGEGVKLGRSETEVLKAIAAMGNVEIDLLAAELTRLRGGEALKLPDAAYAELAAVIDAATTLIDRHGASAAQT